MAYIPLFHTKKNSSLLYLHIQSERYLHTAFQSPKSCPKNIKLIFIWVFNSK